MSGIAERTVRHDFGRLPDLAARRAGGSVVCASDELFAAKENLIESGAPSFAAATFGHKGQIYDGWETRRRRSAGHDWAIIRLGLPGVVSGVVVDTAFFTGNYPPEISVEGCGVEGYPDPAELAAAGWLSLVPRAAVAGDTANEFEVSVSCRVTHVRLRIYPDGGVARLRVHGRAVPDPRLLRGSLVEHRCAGQRRPGDRLQQHVLLLAVQPDLAGRGPQHGRGLGDGPPPRRRQRLGRDQARRPGPDPARRTGYQLLRRQCARMGHAHRAPAWAGRGAGPAGQRGEVELLRRARLQPDTRHRFRIEGDAEVTGARLDVYPDGGMARLRLPAELTAAAREQLALRWFNLLPESQAATVLAAAGDARRTALGARPLSAVTELPPALQAQLGG